MLEAFDLTGSLRDAGELAGVSHHTVARYVAARDAGRISDRAAPRPQLIDGHLAKVEEWVERSKGKVRADVAHDKLVALGFTGSERTTRRAVAVVKANYRVGRVRVHRPWVTEPGMWIQYDFGDGPMIDGVRTTLFVAWLAWSRFRVVLAIRDKTLPSVMAALDVTMRRIGGAPTYVLRNIFGLLWPVGLCGQTRVEVPATCVVGLRALGARHITLGGGDRGFFNFSEEKGSCHVGEVLRQAGHCRSDLGFMDGRGDRGVRGLAGRASLQRKEHLVSGSDRVRVRRVRWCTRGQRSGRVACAPRCVRGRAGRAS